MSDILQRQGSFPVRRNLCHDIPGWVDSGSRYFVTINCRQRGISSLTVPPIAEALLRSLRLYEEQGRWYPWLGVVMPDHLHVIVTFNVSTGIRRTISAWKRFHARAYGIEWQSDFFEHRLRNESEFIEKAAYVRLNPVRKHLVEKVEDWPFLWTRERDGKGTAPPEGSPYREKARERWGEISERAGERKEKETAPPGLLRRSKASGYEGWKGSPYQGISVNI